MLKHAIFPAAITGMILFAVGYILLNADVIMFQNCLETATCYKPETLK